MEDCIFLIVNGMSNNNGMRWDLTNAAEWLDYHPEDDAYAVIDGLPDDV
jgi:uronate dehydrogenase